MKLLKFTSAEAHWLLTSSSIANAPREIAPTPCLDDGNIQRGYRTLRNADCDATLLNIRVNPLGHSEKRRKLDLSPTTPASCASLWALHFASAWGSEGEVVQEREMQQWKERRKELMKGTEARLSSERKGRRNRSSSIFVVRDTERQRQNDAASEFKCFFCLQR